jgi:hypothetical protein
MRRLISVLAIVGLFVFLATGCMEPTKQEQQRENAVNARANSFSRAEKQYPAPIPNTYPERKLLIDVVNAQSSENHPWYVYQFGVNGNVVRYFVSKQFPVNNCDYLSSTEDVTSNSVVLHAPSLLGIYQSGDCGTYVFEDQITGAIETAPINSVTVSDKPLTLKVGAVRVRVAK